MFFLAKGLLLSSGVWCGGGTVRLAQLLCEHLLYERGIQKVLKKAGSKISSSKTHLGLNRASGQLQIYIEHPILGARYSSVQWPHDSRGFCPIQAAG